MSHAAPEEFVTPQNYCVQTDDQKTYVSKRQADRLRNLQLRFKRSQQPPPQSTRVLMSSPTAGKQQSLQSPEQRQSNFVGIGFFGGAADAVKVVLHCLK